MQLPPDLTLADTSDGSPTLAFRRADGYVEHMHHSRGAWTETKFIYGHALEIAARSNRTVRASSIGLGLGYNELLTLAYAPTAEIYSFEASPFLRDQFKLWAEGDDSGVLVETYGRIATTVGGEVRESAGRALRAARLQMRGSFPEDTAGVSQINLVYFDAYSNKMDPHLWAEDMLIEVFDRIMAPDCVLASYAATGSLNRVLRRLGFTRVDKRGFSNKPQSTLAMRGIYAP